MHQNVSSFPSSSDFTVAIVGAGIVGVAAAWFLTRAGIAVRILEAEAPAAAATGAADGAVSVASKRPGVMMDVALAGIRLYRDLTAEGVLDGVFFDRSTHLVAATEEEVEVLEAHAAALVGAGVAIERSSAARLREIAPALSTAARAAIEVRDDGHAIGYDIVRRLIAGTGLRIERGVFVRAIEAPSRAGRRPRLVTSIGPIEADAIVIAAGGGSAALLGLEGVLAPRRGQLFVTERAPRIAAGLPGSLMSARYLLSKASAVSASPVSPRGYGLVVDPLRTGQILIGGTRENDESRPLADAEAASEVLAAALRLVPGLAEVRLLRAFAGLRTAVVDGLPLVGAVPGRPGVHVATGFEGDGICLGPLMGRSIADLVLGAVPQIDLAPFDPGRFGAGRVAA